MSSFSDLFSKQNVIFSDNLNSKEEVITEIAKLAQALGVTNNIEELEKSFMLRESMGPTGMGEELAIPHAKSECVNKASVIVVKSSKSIKWESLDDSDAKLIIALMVPDNNAANTHLKILSAISRKLVNEEFKRKLFGSKTAEEIELLFQEIAI